MGKAGKQFINVENLDIVVPLCIGFVLKWFVQERFNQIDVIGRYIPFPYGITILDLLIQNA